MVAELIRPNPAVSTEKAFMRSSDSTEGYTRWKKLREYAVQSSASIQTGLTIFRRVNMRSP